MNPWESIFMQSPANSGYYDEGELPQLGWQWPKGTWFQEWLEYVREHRANKPVKFSRKIRDGHDMRTM